MIEHKYIKILGIDPGTYLCGFACIQSKKLNPNFISDFQIIDAGLIKINSKLYPHIRIGMLHQQINIILQQIKPDVIVVEKAFSGANVSSALKLGEARGAIISAAYTNNIPLVQLTPAEVKKIITGNGRSSKDTLKTTLAMFMQYDLKNISYDTSDALALALCYGLKLSFDKKFSFNPKELCL